MITDATTERMKNGNRFGISKEFLRACDQAVMYRLTLESSMPDTWLWCVDTLGQRVASLRLQKRKNRQAFASQIGVEMLDLLFVEKGAASPETLAKVVRAVDRAFGTDLATLCEVEQALNPKLHSPPLM